MNNKIKVFLVGSNQQNSTSQNIGILLLRFFVGLAFCTVFEKFLPREGIWGPQEWFIQDTGNMGFPFPIFFAWVAVLSEFFGGILLMLGMFTRPAAFLNFVVTFTATFIYHDGDIGDSGLLSFFFMIMCLCILLFGPGRFSLDYFYSRKLVKKWVKTSSIVLLLLLFNVTESHASNQPAFDKQEEVVLDSFKIPFHLKNNSLLPKKVVFIIYQPQQEGNNTIVKWFLPFQKLKFDLPVKSKIYIATDSQVDVVMQGKRIDSDKPFLRVDEEIDSMTLGLNNQN